MKKYIVTGAAGHLGGTILRLLKNTDCEVCGLLRKNEMPVVESENIRYFTGDVCEEETLEPLFYDGGESVLIHTAGIISISKRIPANMYSVNVNGTGNIINACLKHDVSRLVYVSSVHAIPEPPTDEIIKETDEFSADKVEGGYAKTKAEATRSVLDAAEHGLPAVVVHPSGIIGPYDNGRNHLVQLISDFISGKLPACIRGGYDFVDVRDVAMGCLSAAMRGVDGQCYILSGNYSTVYDMLSTSAGYCDKKPPVVLPMLLARLAAPFIEATAGLRKKRPLYTAYSLNTLRGNCRFSREKAERELNYKIRAFEETVRDTVEWLMREKCSQSP